MTKGPMNAAHLTAIGLVDGAEPGKKFGSKPDCLLSAQSGDGQWCGRERYSVFVRSSERKWWNRHQTPDRVVV